MYKIQVQIDKLYLRFNRSSKKNEIQRINVHFQFKQKDKWIHVGENIKLTQHLQTIKISHIVYVQKQQLQRKRLKYKATMTGFDNELNLKILKYVGDCQINLKDFDLTKRDLPFGIELKLPLRKCPDELAYLQFTIKFSQIQDFKTLYQQRQSQFGGKQNQTEINQKDILLEQQRQWLQTTKKESQRIQNRNQRLSEQIIHLQQENEQLKRQIKQKDDAIKINQQLQEDKLNILIRKKLKASQAYRKVKESIGQVFNLINQYGQLDLIQQMGNLLINQ